MWRPVCSGGIEYEGCDDLGLDAGERKGTQKKKSRKQRGTQEKGSTPKMKKPPKKAKASPATKKHPNDAGDTGAKTDLKTWRRGWILFFLWFQSFLNEGHFLHVILKSIRKGKDGERGCDHQFPEKASITYGFFSQSSNRREGGGRTRTRT